MAKPNASVTKLEPRKSGPTPSRRRPVYLNEIHVLARRKWLAAGKPGGDGTRFWLEAERELLAAR
jgi:hypothetical protein